MNGPPDRGSFDGYAANYDAALTRGIAVSGEDKLYFAQGRIAWLARCLRELGEQPRLVLDFGCGTGSATPFFFELLGAEQVTGVDVSAQSLQIARETYPALAARFHLFGEYEPAGAADLVFCNGVFHHIPLADRAAAVDYIRRSLRPGGLLAFWENNPWNPGTRYVMWRIPFDRDALPLYPTAARRLVQSGGFDPINTSFQFIFPRLLSWFRPFEPSLARWPLGAQYQLLARRRVE